MLKTMKHVLIVEGEAPVRAALKNSFETLHPNYHIATASNGFIALGRLLLQPFDLILADYQLLGMDGLELAEAVREICPKTRILLMSDVHSPPLDSPDKPVELDGYIEKSFTPAQIVHVIEQVMGE